MEVQVLDYKARIGNEKLIIDEKNDDKLPKRFRKTTDEVDSRVEDKEINLTGLKELQSSGSGMFSENGLEKMKEEIGDYPITIVDLRKEYHGFINGMAVSWYGDNNYSNKHLSVEEVIEKEQEKFDILANSEVIEFDHLEKKSEKVEGGISPKAIKTEKELSEENNVNYVRFYVTDHNRPEDEAVDQFVEYIKTVPENMWLHFHCRGGVGRTTTFMTLYDMMKNCQDVNYTDIMLRQVMIGGRDMYRLAVGSYKHIAAVERLLFILKFYEYCLDNYEHNFEMKWSEWIREN